MLQAQHLLTDDELLREEWLSHLSEFPHIPAQGRSFFKDETTLAILVSWLEQL
ncbi:MAG: hypothetical protein RR587_15210 [Solibacillus sp.]